MGSTSPMMSAMVTSGVASFSTKRDSRGSHAIGVAAPRSATSSRPYFEIGANGLSFTSLPARIGISSSSKVTSWRRMRLFACPRRPSRMKLWRGKRKGEGGGGGEGGSWGGAGYLKKKKKKSKRG